MEIIRHLKGILRVNSVRRQLDYSLLKQNNINIIMEILSITIGVIGLFGIIPVIIEFDKYFEIVRNSLSKDDLIADSIQITFDIISPKETRVYNTSKYKVKRNDAKLSLIHCSEYGDNQKIATRIDNRLLKNEFIVIDEESKKMTYNVSDKGIGETFIVEDEFIFTLNDSEFRNCDGNYVTILPYKCKYLNLHIIFPENFIPSGLVFKESIEKNGITKVKTKHEILKYLACFSQNRKQIQWCVRYPKFKHSYKISWYWNPE